MRGIKVSNECIDWINSIDKYCPSNEKACVEAIGSLKQACVKVKRKPSVYNAFMRDCLLGKRGERKEHKVKFKECVLGWRNRGD